MSKSEQAYRGELAADQQVTVQNQGMQTLVTLSHHGPGQQQSQSSSFATGEWSLPPTLFRTIAGFVLRIEASQGQTWVQLQVNSLQVLSSAPLLENAAVLSLQPIPNGQRLAPLPPMPPMQMGNMQMQISPMKMRMGDMQMQMGKEPFMTPSPSSVAFCSQCGQAVGVGDRFCSGCGHRLQPD